MSVASDLNSRKAKLQTILQNTNAEIAAKGGSSASTMAGIPAAVASIVRGVELEEVTITPNGQQIVALPEEGYDGFSKVTVNGDANLVSANIKDGVTIYGVIGTAKGCGADEKNLPIPSDYQSYVSAAKLLYTGDYTGLMILDSGANTVAVCFLMDDFNIQSYDASTTEFSMVGAYYCKYLKDTQTWEQMDYRTSVSTGEHYGKHIKFATRILFYGTMQVWPNGSGNLKEVTVTPTGQQFSVTPESGYDGFNKVIVAGDANLIPENIKAGVIIYGVIGTAFTSDISNTLDNSSIGALYGSVMIAMGVTWDAGDMDNQSFGNSVWNLIEDWLSETSVDSDSAKLAIQELADSGVTAIGEGRLLLNQPLFNSISAFGKWLYNKYSLADNSSVVISQSSSTITTVDGVSFNLAVIDSFNTESGYHVSAPLLIGSSILDFIPDSLDSYGYSGYDIPLTENVTFNVCTDNGYTKLSYKLTGDSTRYPIIGQKNTEVSKGIQFMFASFEDKLGIVIYYQGSYPDDSFAGKIGYQSSFTVAPDVLTLTDLGLSENSSLSVSAPNGLNLPDTDSLPEGQGFAIAFEDVTETDLSGILDASVLRIIAGTLTATCEIL